MLPKNPAPGLLMSMALRYDHALGVPGYYDELFGKGEHEKRLQSALRLMRQLYEEVAGVGFYRPEREAEYAAAIPQDADKPGELAHAEADKRLLTHLKAAERTCQLYFEIAEDVVGEDEVRRRRDEKIKRDNMEQRPAKRLAGDLVEALEKYEMVAAGTRGCQNGYCLVKGHAQGMHTNQICKCHQNQLTAQRMMLAGRKLADTLKSYLDEGENRA